MPRGQTVAGEIVVIPFPCADGSGEKWRPAFVIADLPGADLILCQICFGNSAVAGFRVRAN